MTTLSSRHSSVTPDSDPYAPGWGGEESHQPRFSPIRSHASGGGIGTGMLGRRRQSTATTVGGVRRQSLARIDTRSALHASWTRAELEEQFAAAVAADEAREEGTAVAVPIEPEKEPHSGVVVVDWYDTEDRANPQNWSLRRKIFVSSII